MVVYIVDVLRAQLVAIVVNLVFNVERAVYVKIVAATGKHNVHLCKRIVGKFEHLMQVLVLLLCEVFFAFKLAAYSACKVVARVAYRLNLCYLAKHSTYLGLCFVREMSVGHVVEIIGYLYLHVV